jgi:hypothetical protein
VNPENSIMTPSLRAVHIVAAVLALAVHVPGTLAAQEPPSPAPAPGPRDAFSRPFAFGAYATGQVGSYRSAGLGGRARWEAFRRLGFEVYFEATAVVFPGDGFRHDYPNGFNLYVPFQRGRVRVRPFVGFCDVLSFVRPAQPGAPRANDVLVGVHGGVGGELAVRERLSAFVDLQANVYTGHGRTAQGWTAGVDGELRVFWNVQLNLGFQLHAGR